jgi:AraC-like DNA-binding protein
VPGRINRIVVDLIIAGLRRCAPDALPSEEALAGLQGDDTGVPLEPYREVLDYVYAHAGGAALLQAGRSLAGLDDPLLFVLLNSDSAQLLIEKEARLGRFIHSRHVVRLLAQTSSSLRLQHESLEPEPPRATENLASAGQHIVLFEELGYQGLRLRLPESDEPDRWVFRDGRYQQPGGGRCDVWSFEWDAFVPTRRPMAGLDALLRANDARPELREATQTAASVESVVRTDLGRTWTLHEVATKLDTSTRSLQRALSNEHTRFSDLLDRVRTDEAAHLLRQSDLSVTEIGYVCGFADTSHFSRRFKRRIGSSPSAYRADSA